MLFNYKINSEPFGGVKTTKFSSLKVVFKFKACGWSWGVKVHKKAVGTAAFTLKPGTPLHPGRRLAEQTR